MNYEFPRCNICNFCWTNTNSDESYCEMADGKRITLRNGQGKPSWCPRIPRMKGDDSE